MDDSSRIPKPSAECLVRLRQILEHACGDIAFDDFGPSARSDHAFDETRRDFAEGARGHEEDCGESFVEVAVDIAHASFVLVVGLVADAADNERSIHASGVVG